LREGRIGKPSEAGVFGGYLDARCGSRERVGSLHLVAVDGAVARSFGIMRLFRVPHLSLSELALGAQTLGVASVNLFDMGV
jgi:hypothetical protein